MADQHAASGSTSLTLGARDESWDAGAARKALDPSDYGRAFFWRDPNGDPNTLAAYKLPFASPSGGLHAVWAGVTAAAQRLGSAQIPEADVAGVKRKIGAYYAKARDKYEDDSIQVPWDESATAPAGEVRFAVAPITHVDVRDVSDSHGFWTMSGYAAVFKEKTTLYDGRFLRLTESIAPTAFDRVLREQPMEQPDGVVHFNLGHDMNRSVAATDVPAGQPGSLQLRADPHGLFFLAKVPMDDPDGVAMAAKMRSGVLRQASFAFTVAKDEIRIEESEDGPDVEHRTILEMKHLYDVCATPQGAYAQTVSGLRSLAAALGQLEPSRDPITRQPTRGDETPVSPPGDGAGPVNRPGQEAREAFKREIARKRAIRAGFPSRKVD